MTAASGQAGVEIYGSLDDLPPKWDALFETASDAQSTRAWFAASAEAALPNGARPQFVAVRSSGGPAALIPMQAGPGRQWRSLTTPYTCLFQPLLAPDADAGVITEAAAAFGRHARQWPVILLEALDPAWPGLPPFRAGLKQAGLVTRTFSHFGNWHERLPNSWPAYLEARPGQLRATIMRRTRAAERDRTMRLEFVRAAAAPGPALAAYEAVYALSWKQPEPYPAFSRALVTRLGGRGLLRFGLMWAGDRPIAAQYWTVFRGHATVLKLAHDGAFASASPGTVLTAHAIRTLMEREGVTSIDFGRGDDAYKQGWARERRERIGLLAFNPATARGAAGWLRHDMGRLVRSVQILLVRRQR